MVFGPLADGTTLAKAFGAGHNFIFAITIVAIIVFVLSLSAALNHLLAAVQQWFGIADPVPFQDLLGWVNWPFAWVHGHPHLGPRLRREGGKPATGAAPFRRLHSIPPAA